MYKITVCLHHISAIRNLAYVCNRTHYDNVLFYKSLVRTSYGACKRNDYRNDCAGVVSMQHAKVYFRVLRWNTLCEHSSEILTECVPL